MVNFRTDLAIEAKRLWEKSARVTTKLSGVVASSQRFFDIDVDIVEILDKEGQEQLGKPIGVYATIDLNDVASKKSDAFHRTVKAFSLVLRQLIGDAERILVVGLGNSAIAADSVGPNALNYVIVTRHLKELGVTAFEEFCNVSAVAPNVLGKTGIESMELVRSVVDRVNPDCVIAVDALASCEPERLCMSLQISNTGIYPGAGVGNHRLGLTKESVGVPVYAVGVPTVVDGATYLAIHNNREPNSERKDLVLTMGDIDVRVLEISRLIGYGINFTLHPQISLVEMPCFLS